MHPGGDIILDEAGQDATEEFELRHTEEARMMLVNYYIGDLKEHVESLPHKRYMAELK